MNDSTDGGRTLWSKNYYSGEDCRRSNFCKNGGGASWLTSDNRVRIECKQAPVAATTFGFTKSWYNGCDDSSRPTKERLSSTVDLTVGRGFATAVNPGSVQATSLVADYFSRQEVAHRPTGAA